MKFPNIFNRSKNKNNRVSTQHPSPQSIPHATILNEIKLLKAEMTEQSKYFQKILHKQNETELQLEEILDAVSEPAGASAAGDNLLLEALINIASGVEDFYLLASRDKTSSLYGQAEIMWGSAVRALNKAGVTVIAEEACPVDFRLHQPERAEVSAAIPAGYVCQIIKCGYIFNGQVIKRASVVVSKNGERDEIDGRD